jgi:hypothetical protein
MYTAAFFERDPRQIVDQGLACIPSQSGYALVIRDVLDWSAKHPADWKQTWRMIEEKWDKDDPCPDGALRAFNIDARLNGAYRPGIAVRQEIADAGNHDPRRTRPDCNPSNARNSGTLGKSTPDSISQASRQLPIQFDFTNSLNTSRGRPEREEMVVKAGGTVTVTEMVIPFQESKPAALQQWDMGLRYA